MRARTLGRECVEAESKGPPPEKRSTQLPTSWPSMAANARKRPTILAWSSTESSVACAAACKRRAHTRTRVNVVLRRMG